MFNFEGFENCATGETCKNLNNEKHLKQRYKKYHLKMIFLKPIKLKFEGNQNQNRFAAYCSVVRSSAFVTFIYELQSMDPLNEIF